jgi:hypothetical protein
MGKVSREIAIQDFERWFESKKLPQTKRGGDMEAVENEIIEAIVDGRIVVNDDMTLTQVLNFAVNDGKTDKFNFVHRIPTGVLQAKTAYVKKDDAQGKMTATIAALTNEVGGTIRLLDSSDFSLSSCIAAYFF